MNKYWQIIKEGYSDYWHYLVNTILQPGWNNYFYWLLAISIIVWLLEILFPWRTNQSIVRKDFWLDGFYILFNFFLFSLIIYNAVSNVAVTFFSDMLSRIGIKNMVAINLQALPVAVKFIIMFLVADFIQWNIHRLLHKSKILWQFHKVHHSVEEMGFAAHFRFHFMETIIYKTLQYIPLAMLGFGLTDFFYSTYYFSCNWSLKSQ
jgi:sterol desaturase/sphingolipid hydroxylase (fatty acid hydroxylase superfamily)